MSTGEDSRFRHEPDLRELRRHKQSFDSAPSRIGHRDLIMESASPLIQMDGVQVVYETDEARTVALQEISLDIAEGEFVAIVGPSGCGKSTLLNLVAGLRRPARGIVRYRAEPVLKPNNHVGFVTQQDNLLPWRTVEANVSLPLELRRVPKDERRRLVAAILSVVGLTGFETHYPAELSGGMRKRVTLARTLVYQPEALLLDEPFAALDAQLRTAMQQQLLAIWGSINTTVLFVTHDLEEALLLADRVVVISARPGVVTLDSPVDIPRPRDLEVLRIQPAFREMYARLWHHLKPQISQGMAQ